MNTVNNKRKQQSIKRLKEAFMLLLNEKELKDIKVNDICLKANLNRSTFYSTFDDLYDLIESIKIDYENIIRQRMLNTEHHASKIFSVLQDVYFNQIQYKAYVKLFTDKRHKSTLLDELLNEEKLGTRVTYHILFFKAGFTAILTKWLFDGCKESPEEILEIIRSEYSGRVEMNV